MRPVQSHLVMSEEDKKWRARDDARTLANAQAINDDKERLQLAREAAREMVKDRAEELKGLNNVAQSAKAKKEINRAERIGEGAILTKKVNSRGMYSNPATIGRF